MIIWALVVVDSVVVIVIVTVNFGKNFGGGADNVGVFVE